MAKYLRCIKSVGGRTVGERYKVTAEDDDIRQQIDGLTDAVGKLTLKVAELERKLTEKPDASDYVKVASGPVKAVLPSFAKRPSRDDVIERAKRDVAELERTYRNDRESGISFWPRGCERYGYGVCHYVDYVINRKKRTVVALIRYLGGHVKYRGIAKCAPDDCFNVHIGRAIALRRALSLPVPDEYVSAPQPTEPRVGDVVKKTEGVCAGSTGVVDAIRPAGFLVAEKGLTFKSDRQCGSIWSYIKYVRIIDDSREEDDDVEACE